MGDFEKSHEKIAIRRIELCVCVYVWERLYFSFFLLFFYSFCVGKEPRGLNRKEGKVSEFN